MGSLLIGWLSSQRRFNPAPPLSHDEDALPPRAPAAPGRCDSAELTNESQTEKELVNFGASVSDAQFRAVD